MHRNEKERPGQKQRHKEVGKDAEREEPLFLPDQGSSLHGDVARHRKPAVSPCLIAYDFALMHITAKAQTRGGYNKSSKKAEDCYQSCERSERTTPPQG